MPRQSARPANRRRFAGCTLCVHVARRYVDRARGMRELRADLAAAVRRAEWGERIVVTVAGRPVAQLGPARSRLGRGTG